MTTPIDPLETRERLSRRRWPTTPIRADLSLSFEFFPPKSRRGWNTLVDTALDLQQLDPAFVSVTYGAGGSTRQPTLRTIETLTAAFDMPVAGHLTGVGGSASDVHRLLDRYVEIGVTRVVALRGDDPEVLESSPPRGFRSAQSLVEAIRARPDGDVFDISVAGYPEVHPKAASAEADIESLKRKVDAGADRVITQFFYDNDTFLRFHERARAAGITVPIVAGIMPVHHFARTIAFADRCGATIPDWMHELLGDLDGAPEIRQMIAATIAAEQCRELVEHGIRQFHFYTLNQANLVGATARMLGIRARQLSDKPGASSRAG